MSTHQESAPFVAPVEAIATPQAGHFYRVIWRWHFYAGMFTIPLLLLLAVTGIIYLFKPQLDALMYPQQVAVGGAALPYVAQLDAVRAAFPGAAITKVTPGATAERSTEVVLTTADERELTAFVDPYTGVLLGQRDERDNLQYYAVTLHGELMVGPVGDYVVELAACWAIVLVVTGLYMWWPRADARIWGTLLPRLQRRNRRVLWRDLHAVTGFWGALIVLFMLLTGLPWAGFWGTNFAKIWSYYPAQLWDDVPTSVQLTGSLNQTADKTVPWAVEQLPMPTSQPADHSDHRGHSGAMPAQPGAASGAVTIDTIIAQARTSGVAPGFSVSLPQAPDGVYTVSIFPNDPAQQATLHIDQYSGAVLADVRFGEYHLVPQAVELGIALHEGKYFGLANQLLMLFACLVIITLAVSGVVMWWQRRPAGRLGAPSMPKNFPLWKGAVAIMAVLSVLFPLVGASLVVVLLLDFLLIQRVPWLRQAFG